MGYTINIYLKFALIVLGLLGGIILWASFGFWYGFPLILVGIAMVISYILLGTVQSAAMMLQMQDLDGMEQRLSLTFFPQWLYSANRSYYFLLRGTAAMQRKEFEQAEAFYTQAQAAGLPSDNEKAMILLQLANIRASKNNLKAAEMYVKQAKELKITEPSLKQQIKDFENAIKQNTQAQNTMMRQGFRGFQGGMRRPKMR